ncbi:MAG: 4-hydroxybenzoate polyprenyltransferase [Kiritimatiellia bacterium]|jgi:4-hydroxybenzoate polyprenyltransferase
MSSFATPLVTYSKMIKLSHTIFALPFALAAAVLASSVQVPTVWQIVLIILCMVTARSSAMGFNRIVDRDIDAKNPRTAGREIPAGKISVSAAWLFTLLSAALFVGFSALLGWLTLALAPIALLVIWGYSVAKRYTALCHLVLGLALALAPSAVWIAITGSYGWVPLALSVAVGTWVAGFDVIYSCQDAEFDVDNGLHSIPGALGVRGALIASALLHVVTMASLAVVPMFTALGWPYWVGLVVIGGVLAYEHYLVRPDDLSKINKAFFDLNGYVSLAFLVFVLGAWWLG